MNLTEKTLKREYQYQGKILKMRVDEVELPNGNTATREVVEHPGGVTIAALTDNNELLFVRQFRYPYETVLLELPAGKLDPGENQPLEAAKRELQVGTFYPSAGFCDEVLHLYFCRVSSIGENHPDEDEFIEPILIPIEKAVEMVLNNEIPDGKTGKVKIGIECDGFHIHYNTPQKVEKNNIRDREIKKLEGFDIWHYSGSEIYHSSLTLAKEFWKYVAITFYPDH